MRSDDLAALRSVLAVRAEQLHRLPNVVGTGIGKRRRGGKEFDELCISVSVKRKVPRTDLRDDELVPRELSIPGVDSVPTDVVETGLPKLVEDTTRYRPVRGGCRIVSSAGAGTLGGLAYDARKLEPAFITCWHVLFDPSFFAHGRGYIRQPGSGGAKERIGEGIDAAPMAFGQSFDSTGPGYNEHPSNVVDAAKGDFKYLGSPPSVEFNVIDIGSAIYRAGFADLDDEVWKRGMMSGVTTGRVVQIDYTAPDLDYGGGFYASVGGIGSGFVIESSDGKPFAIPGDSGSVAFSKESSGSSPATLGLIFAAGGNCAYACDVQLAFSALELVTVCRGLYLKGVKQARLRKARFGHAPGDLSFEGLSEQLTRFAELRAYVKEASAPGRVLIDVATAAVPQVADALHRDPVAFGHYVRLMEEFALQSTVLDMLEMRIDDKTEDLFHRLLSQLEKAGPGVRGQLAEISEAFNAARGQRIADFIRSQND